MLEVGPRPKLKGQNFKRSPKACGRGGGARASWTVSGNAVAHEVDIDEVLVGRPMAPEIFEEGGPIGRGAVRLKIAQREGEAWSMPTSVGVSMAKSFSSHSATPRRVQYFFYDGGGRTSTDLSSPEAM
jgi:hypothetical protein